MMTASRTGVLAAGVAAIALLLSSPKSARRGLTTFIAVGVALAAVVFVYQPSGIGKRDLESATSSSGRVDIWRVGISACAEYCATGAGWGTFPIVYADVQASVPGARVLYGDGAYQAHNIWLLVLIELGVVGVILLLWALFANLRQAARLPPTLRGPPMSALIAVLFALSFLSSLEFKFFWILLIFLAINRNVATLESDVGVTDNVDRGVDTTDRN